MARSSKASEDRTVRQGTEVDTLLLSQLQAVLAISSIAINDRCTRMGSPWLDVLVPAPILCVPANNATKATGLLLGVFSIASRVLPLHITEGELCSRHESMLRRPGPG